MDPAIATNGLEAIGLKSAALDLCMDMAHGGASVLARERVSEGAAVERRRGWL
jgi:hypothetical protein